MSTKKTNDGFINKIGDFFKRVNQQDTIKIGDTGINTYEEPQTEEEISKKQSIQVFRQFLQSRNWNVKHAELFDEYRRMDLTYPIINAALRLYSQEVCLSGDTIISTVPGDFTIAELYKAGKQNFYVTSFDSKYKRIEWNMVKGIKNNGLKPIFKVKVTRNIDSETAEWDKKTEATFKCTADHKIMVSPNEFKTLDQLKVGDVIWGFHHFIDESCKCKENVFTQTVIESIESAGEEEVYDLIDVSPNHHFLIKLTDSFYITVHNCTKGDTGNVIEIITSNKRVKTLLEECFFKNLKLNSESYLLVRSLLKFGNHFAFLDTRKGVGVIDLISLPPEAIRIQLMDDGFGNTRNLDNFKYNWFGSGGGTSFEPWEIVHWKNIEDLETLPYGQSILRSIVDTYRRIILMREAMIVYRITRAPQRLLFKIDTTGLDADAALLTATEMKKQMYKKPLINPVTGELDHKYNPISIEENLYMPTTEGDNSSVSVLEGASNLGDIEDYGAIKDDLFAGLLIPKSYLTFEDDLCLRENTKLLTSEGVFTIKELAELMNNGQEKKIYALSCNKYGIIVSGKILWCKETKTVDFLHRITLNNGSVIECTENHPFLLETLDYKRADLLEPGDKLKNMYDLDFTVNTIEKISLQNTEFVYDLEVEEYHNFALESGIFVHNSSKATLAQEDLRFAGAIRQYQSHFIEGLLHIALVHLNMNGCSKEELGSFELQMNINSTLAEKVRMELLQGRFELANLAWNSDNSGLNFMSFTQVLKEILHKTDDEIEKTFEDQLIEKRMAWRMGQLTETGTYREPNIENLKLMGMNKNNNIFSNLVFENKNDADKLLKSIITESVDNEIKVLLQKPKATPTPKMIEQIIQKSSKDDNKFNAESRFKSNIEQTKKDIEW